MYAEENIGWDEPVKATSEWLKELQSRLQLEGDPTKGMWPINPFRLINIWVDPSSLAIGIVLEIDGHVVEDGAWLRPKGDVTHINRSELEAIKGLNMALKWRKRIIRILTDSLTVYRWLTAISERTRNVKSRALDEILIQRRLNTFREILEEEKLSVTISLVTSEENLADEMTRVPKKWLAISESEMSASIAIEEVRDIHNRCHFGVDSTYELVKEVDPQVNKENVKRIVKECDPVLELILQ